MSTPLSPICRSGSSVLDEDSLRQSRRKEISQKEEGLSGSSHFSQRETTSCDTFLSMSL